MFWRCLKELFFTFFIAPIEKSQEIVKMLSSKKLDFSFFEFWSDVV